MRRDTLYGILCVNIATLTWATNIIIGRYLRTEIGPFTLTTARALVSTTILLWLLRGADRGDRRFVDDWRPLAAMALTGVVIFPPLLYSALRFTTAVNGTLINGISPLLTAVFAAVFIREPYTKGQIVGAIMAVLGVAALIGGVDVLARGELNLNPGDLLVLIAAAMWGIYSVAGRYVMRTRGPMSASAISTLMGLPLLIVAAIIEQSVVPVVLSWRLFFIILYLGAVPGAIGIPLWNVGIQRLGPGGAMVFYNTLPLYGTLLGIIALGETVLISHIIGGALIIGGGIFAAVTRMRAAS